LDNYPFAAYSQVFVVSQASLFLASQPFEQPVMISGIEKGQSSILVLLKNLYDSIETLCLYSDPLTFRREEVAGEGASSDA